MMLGLVRCAPLLFSCNKIRVSPDEANMMSTIHNDISHEGMQNGIRLVIWLKMDGRMDGIWMERWMD